MLSRILSSSLIRHNISTTILGCRYFTQYTPYLDGASIYAFKKLFVNKEFLIPILNNAFDMPSDNKITDVKSFFTIQKEWSITNITTLFDIRCTTSANKHIVVEVQRATRPQFNHKSLYNWSYEVSSQGQPQGKTIEFISLKTTKNGKKGESLVWDRLEPVYHLAFCDYAVFPKDPVLSTRPIIKARIRFDDDHVEPVCLDYNMEVAFPPPLKMAYVQLQNINPSRIKDDTPIMEKIGCLLAMSYRLKDEQDLPLSLKKEPLILMALDLMKCSKLTSREILEYERSFIYENDAYVVEMERQKTKEKAERAEKERKKAERERKKAEKERKKEEDKEKTRADKAEKELEDFRNQLKNN